MKVEYRIYDDDPRVPQPKGPGLVDVPDDASDEQIAATLARLFGGGYRVEPPRDGPSIIAADHGWRVLLRSGIKRRIADYTDTEREQLYREGKPGVPLYQADGTFRHYAAWTPADRAYFEQRETRPR